jgi:peptidoglycan/LPS O-acetylase OafA/YrhL
VGRAGSGRREAVRRIAPSVAPVEPPPPRREGQARHKPHLDGVRTLAVYLVVAFHAHLGAFSGGFIGVDVFFVLSGFLVTGILVRYLAHDGHMQWRTFYSRRARRILPAAIVTLCVTAVAYSVIATPINVLDAFGGFRAACLYIANWFFIRQSTNYFAANVNSSPVLHFWSLAVEEQFYIVWPLVLGAVYAAARYAGRWRWWVLRAFAIAAATASLVAALHLYSSNPSRAYYGTDTRAYQLLAGAIIALTPQLLRLRRHVPSGVSRVAAAVSVAAIVLFATSAVHVDPIVRGALAAACVCVMIVALENANAGMAKGLLSTGPITYLGRISYGTYLWHWPLIVLLTYHRSIAPFSLFLIACVTATSLAALSFHVLEHPIRVADALSRHRGVVIAVGFMISVLVGTLFMPAVLDSGGGQWRAARNDISSMPSCVGQPVENCIVVHGGKRRMLLVGDSTARMWIPTLTEIAKRESLTLAVAGMNGCPWQHGLQYKVTPEFVRVCRNAQSDWYKRVIPQFDPDIVVLTTRALDDPARPETQKYFGPYGEPFKSGDVNFEKTLITVSRASLVRLRHPGRRLVIIEPIPFTGRAFDPLNCLSRRHPQQCRYKARVLPTPLEAAYRAAAKASGTTALSMDHIVCPRLPTCDPILHSVIVKHDGSHLTATFALSLWPNLDRMLRNAHVLSTP